MKKLVVVEESTLSDVLKYLMDQPELGFDFETTGTHIYDKPFSLAISDLYRSFYFNFYGGEDHLGNLAAVELIPESLTPLFLCPNIRWFAHNAKFDLMMGQKIGLTPIGKVKCTLVRERLIHNTYMKYSLDLTAKRYGFAKSKDVIEYIKEHNLYKKLTIGERVMEKVPQFQLVPFNIMCDYAGLDSWLALKIGKEQDAHFM